VVYTRCPSLWITPFTRNVWAAFRASHFRSPDIPGQPWQRRLDYTEYLNLPLQWELAFREIEAETYRVKRDYANTENETE